MAPHVFPTLLFIIALRKIQLVETIEHEELCH
jgi:hypothetical protein